MSWFAELAGKAESLLVNFDEQTGAALRNHNGPKQRKNDKKDFYLQTDPPWMQKKRPIPRAWKKVPPSTESKNNFPVGRSSPTRQASQSPLRNNDNARSGSPKPKKLSKKSSPLYTLNNCPKTMVGDMKDEFGMHYGLRQRRSSLPTDLDMVNNDEWVYKIQNLEIENVMLRNELNVLNQEVTELLSRLRKTEDGNDVDHVVSRETELNNAQNKLETSSIQNGSINAENETLNSQLQQLKQKIYDLTNVEMSKYKEQNQSLETEICLLKDKNKELEEKLEEAITKAKDNEAAKLKLETELRHGQSTINELQNNLEKSKTECVRLEKEWETYKLRVKSMLHTKDNEIKALQDGLNLNEDTNVLMEQLEALKEERDMLSEATSRVRTECDEMKSYVSQLEARHSSAERVVAALRDALRDERGARNRVEAQCSALNKELKNLQMETGQTIASLRTALRDKDSELSHFRESSTSVRSTDTSALNVADYDVTRDVDTEKIHVLTQTLVQKQGKIDSLLADNNILRIQLEKLETKYKSEVVALRSNAHSVIHLQDTDCRVRPRSHVPDSALSALSMRIGVMIKRYPIFRLFIFIYMVRYCLRYIYSFMFIRYSKTEYYH
ncbi:hypothetical protein O3G_MSEX013210 [Manduca sexta]|uniref:Golgin-84 n=1 Tax=Manduca sexta TaxID=7130 RepID=A0A921ZS03_MANSE|nr:hypothetical protein O3G_MSEX013210 [Manduca sexta]